MEYDRIIFQICAEQNPSILGPSKELPLSPLLSPAKMQIPACLPGAFPLRPNKQEVALIIHVVIYSLFFPKKLPAALKSFEDKGSEGANQNISHFVVSQLCQQRLSNGWTMRRWEGGRKRGDRAGAGGWRGSTSSAYLLIQIL